MSDDLLFQGVLASIRSASRHELPASILPEHSFVLDLGFDSLAIARLALALEDTFAQPVLLDEWLAIEDDPGALTVASLCGYIEDSRGLHE
jgi:acyl carrier protein